MLKIAFMPSSRSLQRYEDIIANIDQIFAHVEGYDYNRFIHDRKTVDAVERCLQRITEASIKLGSDQKELLPHQDWDAMRGLGNVLRHDYDIISEHIIWNIIQAYLPGLKMDCQHAVILLKAR